MDLRDKTILITGGARAGQAVAEELLAAGAKLKMTYWQEPGEAHPQAKAYQADLTDEMAVEKLMEEVGRLDAVVNMASIFKSDPPPPKASAGRSGQAFNLSFLRHIFAINTFGNMLVARRFAEKAKVLGMKNAPIVAFIDWAVDHPYGEHDVYLASKAALRHYLMALQSTYHGTVRVVNIHPGMIMEPAGFPAEEKAEIIRNTPTGEIGTPQQAAKLVRTALELDFLADNIYLAGGQQWRHRLTN